MRSAVTALSHRLIWRENPKRIVELYQKWAKDASGDVDPGVTMLYGSMYGNTESMMNTVAQDVSQVDIPLEIFDVARTHVSYILPSLWTKSDVVIGAPTYEGKLFPPMAQVLNMAVLKRIVNKKAAYFGSYGWSKDASKQTQSIIEEVKWEMTDPFEFHGGVTESKSKEGELFGKWFPESLLKR